MKKANKILSVIIAAMMCVICMAMPANALDISKSKALKSGKTYSTHVEPGMTYYYKITLTEKGELSWKINFEASSFYMTILDSKGDTLNKYSESGNSKFDYAGTMKGSEKLSKGTYYISFDRGLINFGGSGDTKYKFTFPSDTETSAAPAENIIALYLEEGDDLYIGALIGGKEAEALKFKSSNEKIATVSSRGKLKGVRKGQAIITVTSGSKTVKLAVIVEEDD